MSARKSRAKAPLLHDREESGGIVHEDYIDLVQYEVFLKQKKIYDNNQALKKFKSIESSIKAVLKKTSEDSFSKIENNSQSGRLPGKESERDLQLLDEEMSVLFGSLAVMYERYKQLRAD